MILRLTSEAVRRANTRIQEANSNPTAPDYDKKIEKIKEDLKNELQEILKTPYQ